MLQTFKIIQPVIFLEEHSIFVDNGSEVSEVSACVCRAGAMLQMCVSGQLLHEDLACWSMGCCHFPCPWSSSWRLWGEVALLADLAEMSLSKETILHHLSNLSHTVAT